MMKDTKIPGAPECWYDGYADGQDHPFNQDKNEECKDKGNQYYRALIHGCLSVEGNTEEVCVQRMLTNVVLIR